MVTPKTNELPEPTKSRTAAHYYITAPGRKGYTGLVQFIDRREKHVKSDMAAFVSNRDRFSLLMKNDLGHRNTGSTADIFTLSNQTLGAVRSQILFKVASTQGNILGSTPWFSVMPEGVEDTALAEQVYRHYHWKLNQADTSTVIEGSIERCYNYGESIVRLVWDQQVDRFERMATVLVLKTADGKKTPVLTLEGDYIESDAKTLMLGEDGKPLPAPTPEVPEPQGRMVFADAQNVDYPTQANGMTWEEMSIDEEQSVFNGIRFVHVDYTSFRCPHGFASVSDAPFRGHVYQMLRSELRNKLLAIYGKEQDWPQDIAALWQKTKSDTANQKTDEKQTRTSDQGDVDNPILKMFDCEVYWDAEGNGDARWYFATVLMQHQGCAPVFVDYLANVLPTSGTSHRSLYSAISIDPLPGDWAGRGEWEKYEEFNTLVDRMWNNMLRRDDMAANPITIFNSRVIKQRKETIRFEPGARYECADDEDPRDFMHFVVMPATNFQTDALLQFVMNTNMLETGVTSAAKGGLGDLPATNTATGIQSVLASGSTLSAKPQGDIRRGWEVALTNGATMLYSKQDMDETFAYAEGDSTQLVTLDARAVRNLTANITLLMTRAKNTEIVEKARAAIGTITNYLSTPEMEKKAVRPLYVALIKGLEIPGANDIVRQPLEQDPNQPTEPDPMQSIRISFTDLPTAAKVQFLQKMGFDVKAEDILADLRDTKEQESTTTPEDEK